MLLYDILFLLYLIVECSCFTKPGNRNSASPVLLCVCVCLRRATKETLVETSSSITESLMSISRMMAEQVNQSEDTIGTLGKKKLFFPCVCVLLCVVSLWESLLFLPVFPIFNASPPPHHSHLLQDGAGNQRGVQKHDRNHPPGEEAHPQVQPEGADGQAAHLPGSGPLPRHRPLHP